MNPKHHTRMVLVGISLLWFLAAGCVGKSEPVAFYSLSPESSPETGTAPDAAGGEEMTIGLGPIEIPGYLDRPQIVTRGGGNEIRIAEFRRWAEPLGENFTQTLSEDLARLLATDNVFVYPWPPQVAVTHRILMDVNRFEGNPDGSVNLIARWMVLAGKEDQVRLVRKSRIMEPVKQDPENPYNALVAAKSRAIAVLAGEIAGEIRKLQTGAGTD